MFAWRASLPGDPCVASLGERATEEQCAAFRARYGLDQPILVQFGIYLGQVLRGRPGQLRSSSAQPVTDLLAQRLPSTFELAFFALLFAIIVGIPLGLVSAYKRNSRSMSARWSSPTSASPCRSSCSASARVYVFAILLKDTPFALPPSGRLTPGVTVDAARRRMGPPGPERSRCAALLDFLSNFYILTSLITGQWNALVDALRHMILPAIALGTIPLAIIARITRSSLLDTLGLDYMRTARAKGLGERMVILRHGMRNALLPVVTIIGLQFGVLLGGRSSRRRSSTSRASGASMYEAITGRDYVVIQASPSSSPSATW